MSTAIRLSTDMSHWAPVTRHYEVDGGHLAVTVHSFLTATGTDIYLCDERAIAPTLEPIVSYPAGTSHGEALALLGYTVTDDIGDEPQSEPAVDPTPVEQSVLTMLPAPIAAMVAAATQEEQP